MITTCWIFPDGGPDGLGEGAGVGDGVGVGVGGGFGLGLRLRADGLGDGFCFDVFVERVFFGFLIPAPV
jgi:hypothetical protein